MAYEPTSASIPLPVVRGTIYSYQAHRTYEPSKNNQKLFSRPTTNAPRFSKLTLKHMCHLILNNSFLFQKRLRLTHYARYIRDKKCIPISISLHMLVSALHIAHLWYTLFHRRMSFLPSNHLVQSSICQPCHRLFYSAPFIPLVLRIFHSATQLESVQTRLFFRFILHQRKKKMKKYIKQTLHWRYSFHNRKYILATSQIYKIRRNFFVPYFQTNATNLVCVCVEHF